MLFPAVADYLLREWRTAEAGMAASTAVAAAAAEDVGCTRDNMFRQQAT